VPQERDPFTNPDELFDVLDAAGNPTGRAKRRADVHRDGDWHRALHCWVLDLSDPARPCLLYQRRGAHKDTWPARLDVTVGGHYASGETLADVLREVEEEIGQAVALDQLVRLGTRQVVSDGGMGGTGSQAVKDCEIQDVFLWRSTLPLETYRPQPVEVTALERVSVADALALLSGQVRRAPSRRLLPDGEQSDAWVSEEDLIPTLDRYFYRLAVAADLAARGYPHLVV
jgi:isopentenyldiphosphate isomerase